MACAAVRSATTLTGTVEAVELVVAAESVLVKPSASPDITSTPVSPLPDIFLFRLSVNEVADPISEASFHKVGGTEAGGCKG
jgi:hypothetical protein